MVGGIGGERNTWERDEDVGDGVKKKKSDRLAVRMNC